MNIVICLSFITLTVIIYGGAKYLYKRIYSPVLVPIATSTLMLAAFLLLSDVSYDTYMIGGSLIEALLGPAVVALAYPLYKNRDTLLTYFIPISVGVLIGTVFGLLSGVYLARFSHLDRTTILSLASKSVTTPVAMDITTILNGIPSLAAVYVMFAGISGSIFGPILLKKIGISNEIGIGIGLGSASHGIGTAKALELGKKEAAISSVSMTLSAIYASILFPFLVKYLL